MDQMERLESLQDVFVAIHLKNRLEQKEISVIDKSIRNSSRPAQEKEKLVIRIDKSEFDAHLNASLLSKYFSTTRLLSKN